MGPVRRLLKRSMRFRFEQLPRDFGSGPVILFPYISKFSREARRPISVGIVPAICVLETMSSFTFVSLPMFDDSVPVSKFILR
jgi:hypothetical protein